VDIVVISSYEFGFVFVVFVAIEIVRYVLYRQYQTTLRLTQLVNKEKESPTLIHPLEKERFSSTNRKSRQKFYG